jgi:deoxyadenosine/deoxycytidine kinase
MLKKYIVVAGNIGAGKSSLVEFLCRNYPIKPFYEPNDVNPYLDLFYKNMKAWAFHSQIHFLSHKFRIHQELARETQTVLQDRSIYEDAEIFATHLFRQKILSKRDFETYMELYRTILKSLPLPDLLIYLKCSVRTVKKRIKQRGRESEQSIPTPYLSRLNRLYGEWIGRYELSPVVEISTEKMDYLTDLVDRIDLLERVEKLL